MGVYEEKAKLAGMDDRSVLVALQASFDRFRETTDGGLAGQELQAALASARDIAAGDFESATKREARELAGAALEAFVEEAGRLGDGESDVPAELTAGYLNLVSIFESEFPESAPALAEISRELRKQAIRAQLRRMSPEERRLLLRELVASSG